MTKEIDPDNLVRVLTESAKTAAKLRGNVQTMGITPAASAAPETYKQGGKVLGEMNLKLTGLAVEAENNLEVTKSPSGPK